MRLRISIPLIAVAAMLGSSIATISAAGEAYGESVHADSFGNLVIYSPAGYKRIVVGQGHLAGELSRYQSGDAPEIVYAEEPQPRRDYRHCYSRAETWRGRERMYGLADGEIPQPRIICE